MGLQETWVLVFNSDINFCYDFVHSYLSRPLKSLHVCQSILERMVLYCMKHLIDGISLLGENLLKLLMITSEKNVILSLAVCVKRT